jgi:hypothetical protein
MKRVHGENPVNLRLSNGENPPDSLIHRFSDSLIPDSPKQPSSSEQKSQSDQLSGGDWRREQNHTPPGEKEAPSSGGERLAELLKQEILRNKVDFRITPIQLRKWSVTADRMIRLDGRTEEQIANLIRWVQQDNFWMANVLSMDTLRGKFDQLELKRAHAGGNGKLRPTNGQLTDINYGNGLGEENPDGSHRF